MQMTDFLTYQEFGNGPAVVLLHDTLLSSQSWSFQVEALQEAGFRVIIPELRGLSGSGSLVAYSHAIAKLLSRLGIGRYAVCGMGMGGSILLEMLAEYRERISGACFINTRPGADDIHEKLKRAQIIAALGTSCEGSIREELYLSLIGDREELSVEADRLKIHKVIHNYSKDALLYNLEAMQGRRNHVKLLKTLDLPVLLVTGIDDQLCHPGYATIMSDQLLNCREIVSLNGGHLIQIEAAFAVNCELVNFLHSFAPQCKNINSKCTLRAA